MYLAIQLYIEILELNDSMHRYTIPPLLCFLLYLFLLPIPTATKKISEDNLFWPYSCPALLLISSGASAARSGNSLALDALLIALVNGCSADRQWYVPTGKLQLACLQLCTGCRDLKLAARRLVVTSHTPHRLWLRSEKEKDKTKQGASRVPTFAIHSVTWAMSAECISEGSTLLEEEPILTRGNQKQTFLRMEARGFRFYKAWWPESLRELRFGEYFNEDIGDVVWPTLMRRLTFGREFNQPIDEVTWPATLTYLTFGRNFDQPIDEVVWPISLQQLTFGEYFDQEIENVLWPKFLQRLSFGYCFEYAIDTVTWPKFLKELTLGYRFSQPIDDVVWPSSLQYLSLGDEFNEPVENIVWPQSLHRLTFGEFFNQPVIGVTWPNSLQQLTFGYNFNRPIEGVTWPASLQMLAFGWYFNQPISNVVWPDSLQQLTFGRKFNQSLSNVRWPSSLQRLTLEVWSWKIYKAGWPPSLKQVVVRGISYSVSSGLIHG